MIGPTSVAASAARTTTGSSGGQTIIDPRPAGLHTLALGVNVTAVSGTTPSMTLTVEWSVDGGVTFLKGDPVDTFTAITAVGTAVKSFTPKGNAYRVTWTITGTTPSFTFDVAAIQY